MVTLDIAQSSNSQISSTLPQELVAVFIGAASGIGEITLKKFAKYSLKPRVYFIGRSQEAGGRIAAQCRGLNPTGQFTFIKAGACELDTSYRRHMRENQSEGKEHQYLIS